MPEGFVYGGSTILSHPIFVETILPFLLVFTIVFAVLQKSKILGEGKRQIDAIVGLVVGLLVISFGQATGVIIQLTYFLAVALVIILVLMILLGSFTREGKFFEWMPKGLKWILSTIVIIAVVIAVLVVTDVWGRLYDYFFMASDTGILANVIFVVAIIGAIVAVILGGARAGTVVHQVLLRSNARGA